MCLKLTIKTLGTKLTNLVLVTLLLLLKVSFEQPDAAVRRCFSKSMFLKISQYLKKTPVLEPLFNKVAELACNFIKKRLRHRCVPVNIAKFLRTAIFIEQLWCSIQHFWTQLAKLSRLILVRMDGFLSAHRRAFIGRGSQICCIGLATNGLYTVKP